MIQLLEKKYSDNTPETMEEDALGEHKLMFQAHSGLVTDFSSL